MRLISPAAAGMLTVELLADRLKAALWGVYIGTCVLALGVLPAATGGLTSPVISFGPVRKTAAAVSIHRRRPGHAVPLVLR